MAEFNQDSGDSAYISGVFELSIHDSDLTLTDSTFYSTIQLHIQDSVNTIIGGTAEGNTKKIYWRS